MMMLLVSLLGTLLKALLIVFALYLFYWRVFDYLCALWFYKRQGRDVIRASDWHLPLVGNAYMIAWSTNKSEREGDNYFVLKHWIDYMMDQCDNCVSWLSNLPSLCVGDVKVVEAMYTTKNKYFDKHPSTCDLAFCLTGDSILFSHTTDEWRTSRKAISPAFYKGKLESLLEKAKEAMRITLTRFQDIAAKSPATEINIMEEIGLMTARILLVCALGVDCAEDLVDYWVDGKCTKRTLAFSLRETFSSLIHR